MESSADPQCLSLPIAPLAAVAIGGAVTVALALGSSAIAPGWLADSGIVDLLTQHNAPDVATARIILLAAAGAAATLVAWFGLFLLLGARAIVFQSGDAQEDMDQAPVLRRADAHPDAPARRPLSASRELGTPFLEVRAPTPVSAPQPPPPAPSAPPAPLREHELPRNLDMPLAAFDPQAIPEQPIEWFVPPMLRKARRRALEEATGLRGGGAIAGSEPPADTASAGAAPSIDSPRPAFDHDGLSKSRPMSASQRADRKWAQAGPRPGLDASASIHALLDRLEREIGVRERPAPLPPEATMSDAFATLKRIAARG